MTANTEPTTVAAHEDGFISAFVIPEKRTRYAEFLPNPKRRNEILNRFNHFFDLIPERATKILCLANEGEFQKVGVKE